MTGALAALSSYLADRGERRREALRRGAARLLEARRCIFYLDDSERQPDGKRPEKEAARLMRILRSKWSVEAFRFDADVFHWSRPRPAVAEERDFASVLKHAEKMRGADAYVVYAPGALWCPRLLLHSPFKWFLVHPDDDEEWKRQNLPTPNEMSLRTALDGALAQRMAG